MWNMFAWCSCVTHGVVVVFKVFGHKHFVSCQEILWRVEKLLPKFRRVCKVFPSLTVYTSIRVWPWQSVSLSLPSSYKADGVKSWFSTASDRCILPYLEGGKGVWGDVKSRHLHVVEETVEVIWLENDLGERLVADALPQHDPTIQRHLGRLVPWKRGLRHRFGSLY